MTPEICDMGSKNIEKNKLKTPEKLKNEIFRGFSFVISRLLLLLQCFSQLSAKLIY